MSITEAQAYEAVAQRWKLVWDVLHPEMLYALPNESFTEPDGATTWARVELRPLDSVQETLGKPQSRQYRRDATVWVWLYTPRNVGVRPAAALVDDVRKVFEGESYGGIDPAGAMRSELVGSDGRWYEVAAVIPVTYYETR